jgi:phosphatidylglycerophosphate synthase
LGRAIALTHRDPVAGAPQHWLSLARLAVGAFLWLLLPRTEQSGTILPLVLLACVLDFADGRLARARGAEGPVGRVLDNLCDFAFLAMFFHAAAGVGLWSAPVDGVAVRWWPRANALPLIALTMSFGCYAARAVVCAALAMTVAPSPVGRAAGVLNYFLALVGAAAVSLRWGQPSMLIEVTMALVVFVNLAACLQNCVILARQMVDGRA